MSEHTPLPWELHAGADGFNSLRICKPDNSERSCRPIAEAEILTHERAEAEANARFIVRACNSHDGLLAALEGVKQDADAGLILLRNYSDVCAAIAKATLPT